MKNRFFKKLFKRALFLIFLLLAYPLYAQTNVETATREIDRFDREAIEEKIEAPPEKPAEIKIEKAPVPEEKEQRFFIKKINLQGVESISLEKLDPIIKEYEHREVTLSELNTLAKKIEQAYLKEGIIAAVFLPPQEIKDQTVTLQVVEARMGGLQIQDHPHFKKQRLAYYWQISAGEVLRYDKISQSLKMMSKNPDREVKATLSAGRKPGTTDVLLTVKTRFPIHLVSTYDREGVVATGRSRTGVGIRHNNLLGLDDMFLSGYTFGRDFSGRYFYHHLPVSPAGAFLLYGYSYSKSVPTKQYQASGVNSNAENTRIYLNQDLYQKGEYTGTVFLGFETKDKAVRQNTGVYSRDRLRIFRLGGDLIQRDLQSKTIYSCEVSQGVDAFGASSRDNSLVSRQAQSRFTKLKLGLQQKRNLPLDLQANLKFNTQISSTKITPQEEFSLGGIDSVRGYPPDDFLADNAVLTSAELLIPSFFIPRSWRLPYAESALRDETTAVVFLDYGWGERRGALPTEEKDVNFLGIGTGLRIRLFNQVFLRLEWGFPVGDNTVTEAGDSYFHFSVDFQK